MEQIVTERLLLKKFTPEDFKFIFENYSKERIMQILGLKTDEAFEKEKNKFEKGYTTYNMSLEFFQMILIRSDEIIGGCGFHNWFPFHRRAELGYSITDKNHWNKGLMTEALDAVIKHGFTTMKLQRIEALVADYNIASLKLLKKFGFTQEGVLRKHYYVNDTFEDSILFSKLLSDN